VREPERRRGFKAPGGVLVPILSIAFCMLLMAGLPVITWMRFFGWLVIGLGIYYFYSRKHSEFCPECKPSK
jgi:basic amino acid/polyamine antiporter, APA family